MRPNRKWTLSERRGQLSPGQQRMIDKQNEYLQRKQNETDDPKESEPTND